MGIPSEYRCCLFIHRLITSLVETFSTTVVSNHVLLIAVSTMINELSVTTLPAIQMWLVCEQSVFDRLGLPVESALVTLIVFFVAFASRIRPF